MICFIIFWFICHSERKSSRTAIRFHLVMKLRHRLILVRFVDIRPIAIRHAFTHFFVDVLATICLALGCLTFWLIILCFLLLNCSFTWSKVVWTVFKVILLLTMTFSMVFLFWEIYLNIILTILTICRVEVFHLLLNLLSFKTFLNRWHLTMSVLKGLCFLACADNWKLSIVIEPFCGRIFIRFVLLLLYFFNSALFPKCNLGDRLEVVDITKHFCSSLRNCIPLMLLEGDIIF